MKRRIFGLENEYGLTCTLNGQRRLSPDNVARYLFEQVIRHRPQFRVTGRRPSIRSGVPEGDRGHRCALGIQPREVRFRRIQKYRRRVGRR